MRVSIRFLLAFVLLSLGEKSWGQLLQWNTFNNLGTETSEPSIFNNANISSSNLTFGAGVTPAANGNRFGGNAWFDAGNTNPTTLSESIADNDYVEFIVTPTGGFSFTPTSFVFNWERSTTGPSSLTLRSSVDGFTADLGTLTGLSTSLTTGNTITISGLTNLSTATTFRLYGYAATSAAGTGGFDLTVSGVNVQLNGTACFLNPVVTNNLNSGPGSLRQAVLDACPGSTITFSAAVVSPISLSDGQIILDKNLIIQGPATPLTIQNTKAASSTSNIFDVRPGVQIELLSLSLTGGNVNAGNTGGAITNAGTLLINNCEVVSNTSLTGGGIFSSNSLTLINCTIGSNVAVSGGGIYSTSSSLTNIRFTTISNNQATGNGGGICYLGSNTLALSNSTISGNVASSFGGGIDFASNILFSNIVIVNCTISNNLANTGGGINHVGVVSNLALKNTIIAANSASSGPDVFSSGVLSLGFNLIGKTDGSSGWDATDLTGTVAIPLNPGLSPLADNGGPTMTHALFSNSPAIDNGVIAIYPQVSPVTYITIDQRGNPRPFDVPAIPNVIFGNGSDIGAFEYQCIQNPIVINNLNSGPGSLRQAVLDACPGSTISFDMSTVVSPILLSDGQIILDKNLIIQGPGANVLYIRNTKPDSPSPTSNVFEVRPGVNIEIVALTLSGGNINVPNAGGSITNQGTLLIRDSRIAGNSGLEGAGVWSNGILTINNSTISDNAAYTGNGGGIGNISGTLNITNSTIIGNSALSAHGGGISNSSGGTLNVTNSTISNNLATNGLGAGIYNNVGSTMNVTNSTISENFAGDGSGIYTGGIVNSRNSIIAVNFGGTGPDFKGTVTSQGYNLIGNTTGSTGWIASDLQNVNPNLGPIANNGGPTMTHALLSNSPAIDKGAAADYPGTMTPIITDQRGSTRPIDDPSKPNATGGNGSDIGAFEIQCISGNWLGTTSSDWFDPANWSCGIVPTATTDVTIPSGTPFSPLIAGNTAQVHNITIQPGAILTNNSTLNINGGGVIVNNGSYKGSGNFTGATFNNGGGILAPGASPGCTSFAAGYTNDTGTEQIEIGGLTNCSLYDRLVVTGTATLSGILTVSLFNGYLPVCGESYTIMTSTTLSGTFPTINYPALPAGLSWSIQYNFPNTGDVTLSVVGPPTAVATPSSQTKCSGLPITTIVLNGSPIAGTVYNWTRDNGTLAGGTVTGIAAAGSGNISGTLTNTTAAPVTVTFTITPVSGSCSGTPIAATVLVNPTTPVSITGGGTFCSGNTTTLAATPGFSSYSWTRFGGPGELGTGQTLLVTKSGLYNVAATNVFGCTSNGAAVVEIGDYIFNGSLSAGSTSMATRLIVNGTTSTCAVPKVCPGNTGAAGPFVYDLYTITNINPNPVCAIVAIDAQCNQFIHSSVYLGSYNPANICQNYLADQGFGTIGGPWSYEVTIPGGATIVIKVNNFNSGLYCNDYRLVVDIPRMPAAITATPDINICSGEQVTLTASLANTYLWSPGGATTQSITVSPSSFTTYTVTLGYGNNGCTTGVQQSIFVSPTPTVVAGPMTQTICSGNPITTIQVTSNPINATKEWTRDHTGDVTGMPGNGVGNIMGSLTNTTNSPITVTFTITVTAGFNRGENSEDIRNCPSQPIHVTVIVNPVPNAMASATTQTICSGNAVINLSGNVPGTIFNWTRDNTGSVTGLPANGTGDINGVLTNTTSNPITVTFTITPTYNNAGLTCSGTPITATIIVKPRPDVFASVPAQGICNNQSINPIVITGNFIGTQFSWTRDNTTSVTGIAASGNGSINGALTNITGVNQQVVFTITPGLNGCTGTPVTATVDVSPTVTGVLLLASNDQLCAGMNGGILVNLIGAPTFIGSFRIKNLTTNAVDLYIWSSALLGGPQNIAIPASYLPNTTGTPITYEISFYSLTDANGCTGALSGAANITVYPRPILVVTDPPPGNTCSNGGVNFMVTELYNIPGVFAVTVRDANNQIVGLGSNLPFGVYHFDGAGCATPGPLSFTFTANGPGPLQCPGLQIVRTLNITDNQPPSLTGTLPGGNSPNTCSANAPAAPAQATIRALYTDNCTSQAALIVSGPVSNLTINGCNWTQTYTYTVTDGCGNSAEAIVIYTGADSQAPTWNTAAGSLDRTVDYCDLNAQMAAEALMPSATDNCTAVGSITITKTAGVFVAGACPTTGTITHTFIARDLCNNASATFTQTITVADANGPSFFANIPTTSTSTCAATVANYITSFGISATDCFALGSTLPFPPSIVYNNNTQGNNMIWQSPAPGTPITTAPGSILVVTIMARDGCGNTSSYSINVFVSNITGSISGTVSVQQNPAGSSLITFTGTANGAPAGTQQYQFNYSLSIDGGPYVAQAPVTTILGQNSISVSRSHAVQGIFAYRLDGITDLTTMCIGTVAGNTTATITVGATGPLDFTPVMVASQQGLGFASAGVSKDFIVGVTNISPNFSSTGQIILRLVKTQGFTYTIGAATTTVFSTAVQNSDWLIDTSNPFFVVFTLKPGVVIPPNGDSRIGFTVTRNVGVASGTTQNMTSIIQNGTGGDINNTNNTVSMAITAH